MGLISQLKEWLNLEVLTHTDLNAEFAQLINTINELGNANWSDEAADRLVGSKISVKTNNTFLAEHTSVGVHTAYATNNAEACRIFAGTTEESQINIRAKQLNLYNSDNLISRIRKLVGDVVISNLDITQSGDGGGIDTGAEAGGTWYFIWVIADSDGKNVKGLLSTTNRVDGLSFNNAISYTGGYYVCIGKIYNDADEDFGNPYGAPGVITSGTTTDPGKGVAPTEGQSDLTAGATAGDQGYAWIGPLLVQWGMDTATTGGATITFPKKFPTACLQIVATNVNSSSDGGIGINAMDQTEFNLRRATSSGSVRWIAIGY